MTIKLPQAWCTSHVARFNDEGHLRLRLELGMVRHSIRSEMRDVIFRDLHPYISHIRLSPSLSIL